MLGLLKINLNLLKSRIYMINKYAEIGVRTTGYTIYQRPNYSTNKILKNDLVNRKVLESRNKLEVCKVQPYPGCNSKLRLPQDKLPIPKSTALKCPPFISKNPKDDKCNTERKISPAKTNKVSPCSSGKSSPPPEDPPGNMKYYALILALIGGLGGAWAYHKGLFHKKERDSKNIIKVQTDEECETNMPAQPCGTKHTKFPETSKEIPCDVPYLLIGGGTASFSAFRAIKSHDPTARVLVITDEYEMPYMRPPLSKEIWFNDDEDSIKNLKFKQWNGTERSLYYEPDDFYVKPQELCSAKNGGVAIVRGYRVKKIDAFNQKVILNDGYEISYKQCCLATGSQPKKLVLNEQNTMELENNENVTFFKTIKDFEVLKEKLTHNKTIAIIGGGFLGSELSCALAKYGLATDTKIFYEIGNMGKILPEYLSKWTMNCIKHEGVNIIAKSQIKNITYNKTTKDKQLTIKLFDGKQIFVDHIIVTIGSQPNVNIGKLSNLEVDEKFGGYVVNAELEARRNLYVAGDAACFFDPILGRRRVEHHDHAVVSGRLAGENMVGLKKPYTHQSMFWSDLGPKIGFEAIGLIDSSLTTVGVFAKSTDKDTPAAAINDKLEGTPPEAPTNNTTVKDGPLSDQHKEMCKNKKDETVIDEENDDFGKGVIFYLRDNKVVGILLWNVFNRINIARKIISECKEYKDLNEVAKLFKIHE